MRKKWKKWTVVDGKKRRGKKKDHDSAANAREIEHRANRTGSSQAV